MAVFLREPLFFGLKRIFEIIFFDVSHFILNIYDKKMYPFFCFGTSFASMENQSGLTSCEPTLQENASCLFFNHGDFILDKLKRRIFMFTNWTELSPFTSLKAFEELQQELNRWLNQESSQNFCSSTPKHYPPIQLGETADQYQILVFVPGLEKEQLEIQVHKNVLEISGKRENAKGNQKYLQRGRFVGSFSRRIPLPELADADKIEAHYKNGVLTIRLGKREELKPRQIQVKVD